MRKMIIFEPAMCCSTGVCGPSVNPELLRVATIVNAFEKRGVSIRRSNLTNNPQAFVDNRMVNSMINEEGLGILPITIVDGEVVKTGSYPTNQEFCRFLDIPMSFLNTPLKYKSKGCGCKGGCC